MSLSNDRGYTTSYTLLYGNEALSNGKVKKSHVVRVEGMSLELSNGSVLGGVSLALRPKGVCKLINDGKDNGAVLVGYVYKFIRPARNRVDASNEHIKGSISCLPGTKVVVRAPKFVPCCDKLRGLQLLTKVHEGIASSRVHGTLGVAKLSPSDEL